MNVRRQNARICDSSVSLGRGDPPAGGRQWYTASGVRLFYLCPTNAIKKNSLARPRHITPTHPTVSVDDELYGTIDSAAAADKIPHFLHCGNGHQALANTGHRPTEGYQLESERVEWLRGVQADCTAAAETITVAIAIAIAVTTVGHSSSCSSGQR